MSERTERHTASPETVEKIDLTHLAEQLWEMVRRYWWIVAALTALFAAASWLHVSRTYVPRYEAEATLAIYASRDSQESGSNSSNSVATAQQLGKVFPYILTSGILSDMVAEDLGTVSVPGEISVTAVEDTNLVTIRVTASDGQTAYDVLQSVLENYPQVAQFVIGQTEYTILSESGVPTDSGTEYVTRGSVRRGAALGFAAGMALMVFFTLLRRTIRRPSDFQSLFHVPCLGTLPVYQEKKRRKNKGKQANLLASNVPQSYLEAIRALRARVERKLEQAGCKTLLVTSSIPEEGKSTVAANLAIAMAQKGLRVILVDCDLRHPSIQSRMGIAGAFPGLVAVLKGQAALEDALYQVPVSDIDLKVLCGARNSAKEVEILGGAEMKRLIAHFEQMADVVILDTSPSAMLADAMVLAHNVPAARYVVRYDHTRVEHVLSGIEELSGSRINIIGCVLNEGKFAAQSSYGYRYGRYGYGRSRYSGAGR